MNNHSETIDNFKTIIHRASVLLFSVFITLIFINNLDSVLANISPTSQIESFSIEIFGNNSKWTENYFHASFLDFPWSRAIFFSFLLFLGYAVYKYRISLIQKQKEELEVMVLKRTGELKRKNKDLIIAKKEMDDILENVKEGLFLINRDFNIESQYSAALEGILSKKNLGKTSFIDYFRSKLTDQEVKSIKDYLEILFDDNVDDSLVNDLNPLSNTKLEFSYTKDDTITKYLTFEFGRIIQDGTIIKIIASVNDITEKLILERNLEISKREVEQRANRLQVILSIEPAMLREFIESTKDELGLLNKIIRDNSAVSAERLNSIYRSIHVIKGNASLLGFSFFADHAHEIEDFISEIHKAKNYTKASMYNIKCLVVGLNDLYHELKTLIERLYKFLEQFKDQEDENSTILVRSLKKMVKHISEERDVNVNFVAKNLDNFKLPQEHRLVIKDILVQLVRNSIFHGIEGAEERAKNKKDMTATILVSSYKIDEGGIGIKVRDDGRGLQVDRIKEKAIASGKWEKKEINQWDDNQVYQSIFTSGITTAETVTITSGRGVGMDIIKNKLDSIGGQIKIKSKEGKYCEFIMEIPKTSKAHKKTSITAHHN